MIYTKETFIDSLTLDLAKEHLNVSFAEDDNLITSYINSSLLYMEKSTNRIIKSLKYINSSKELLPVEIINNMYFKLHLPYTPYSVMINSIPYNKLDEMYNYISTEKTLFIDYDKSITSIVALCGPISEMELIHQARLMLIGNWYAFRESDIIASINEVPNGVTRIIDVISSSPI